GAVTVFDCMKDEKLSAFLQNTLTEEIIPFVSDDVKATTVFADSIKERFLNPYLNHLLTSISLNSISKWKARNLPSFKDYYNRYGIIPKYLTIGFSYLMAIYSSIKEKDGKYYVALPSRDIEIMDDKPYLDYFSSGKSISNFMSDVSVWGENLCEYKGFEQTVIKNVEKILQGDSLI
ncbi:MAG: tagaturonate reductase, partial [Clostridia bacterium]|nr:tagaturonate reductase [Clostridia bacterium]